MELQHGKERRSRSCGGFGEEHREKLCQGRDLQRNAGPGPAGGFGTILLGKDSKTLTRIAPWDGTVRERLPSLLPVISNLFEGITI